LGRTGKWLCMEHCNGCREGCAILTLGTAGVLYRYAGNNPGPYSPAGLWGPYPGGGFYELLCLNHACSALDWADGFLHGSVDSGRFVQAMRQARVREDSVLFYPDDWGTPSAWKGEGTPQEKAYAVLEGIGFALRHLAGEGFRAEKGRIVILGGGSRLDDWVQLVADLFGREFVRSGRDGLGGAAILAGVPLQGGEETAPADHFSPRDEKRGFLDRRFQSWKNGLGR